MSQEKKFTIGQVVATFGALDALNDAGQLGGDFLNRHQAGDWGELCDEDRAANDAAVQSGQRILSQYTLRNEKTLWIITERGREVTTLLLPGEY